MKKGLIFAGLILLAGGGCLLLLSKREKEAVKKVEESIPTIAERREEGGEMGKLKTLFVVAPKDFRDEELFEPKKVLEEKEIEVEVSSKGVSQAFGMLGGKISVDKDLNEVKVEDYEAVVFVGGTGASIYFNDSKALSLAREAYEKGKVVGAICIAPSILANSGILQGKRATSFSSEIENLKSKGADYTGEGLTVDGRLVTAQGPNYATEFGEKIVEMLGGDWEVRKD